MAGAAVSTELSIVVVFGGVAGITICRCTLIYIVHVTGSTCNIGMRAAQGESCFAMIEGYILPAAGVMAGTTVSAELSIVVVFGGMTGITICRCALVNAIGMTSGTLHANVIAS